MVWFDVHIECTKIPTRDIHRVSSPISAWCRRLSRDSPLLVIWRPGKHRMEGKGCKGQSVGHFLKAPLGQRFQPSLETSQIQDVSRFRCWSLTFPALNCALSSVLSKDVTLFNSSWGLLPSTKKTNRLLVPLEFCRCHTRCLRRRCELPMYISRLFGGCISRLYFHQLFSDALGIFMILQSCYQMLWTIWK